MFEKLAVVVFGALLSAQALAAQDYSAVQTALTAEITAAMPVVLALLGLVLAIGLGIQLIKKGTKG